jgi:hypothetical protein
VENVNQYGGTSDESRPSDLQDEHDAGIRAGGDVTQEDLEDGGLVGSTTGTGTGGLADVTGGGSARGDMEVPGGGATGSATGGRGMEGSPIGSTEAGRIDITGGGTAGGLGGTKGDH